jgi:two-component system alkaline phosphatase synthesis response regulator PhoP
LPRVLIVEDEPGLLLGLQDNCEYEGYEVLAARDGQEALDVALAGRPDLILLDVMLPKMSGLDVCRILRQRGVTAPIIMLTARSQEVDKVVGLEVGADDYVTKPFGVRELMARVRAQLRRASTPPPRIETCRFGDIELDFQRHQATRAGRPLALTPREFEMLKYFARRRSEVVTREELLDHVWGLSNYPFTRTVDNHVAKLRRKIEPAPARPRWLITVHRVGYKFLG